jgi:peptidoglycan/xylan/chitin deacetylase (PgdA/CDA1 family)
VSLRWLFRALSPGGRRGRLAVMIYHRVLERPDPLFPGEPDAARFDAQLSLMKRWFNVLPLPDAIRGLREGCLPARSLTITFDDGYADNCAVGLPILQRHGVRAAFFIATDYLDGGRMWNDTVIEAVRGWSLPALDVTDLGLGQHPFGTVDEKSRAISSILNQLKYLPQGEREAKAASLARRSDTALPDRLMLTSDQVRQLHQAGMTLGAHTASHPILACLPDEQARSDIVEGKARLERTIGESVRFFAYPNGRPGQDYHASHVRMVREAGFEAAFSTAIGTADAACDPFQIPRFRPWGRTATRYGLRLARTMARRTFATA